MKNYKLRYTNYKQYTIAKLQWPKPPVSKKKGIALAAVLIFMALLVLAVFSIVTISVSEVQAAKSQSSSTKAFYLAEAGTEFARAQVGDSWANRTSGNGSMGDGTYVFNIYDTDSQGNLLASNKLRIRSLGQVGVFSRIVETVVKSYTAGGEAGITGVTVAVEAEGSIEITGNAEVDPDGSIAPGSSLNFEDVFGITKEELEGIVIAGYPSTLYYNDAFNNNVANGITWVNAGGIESRITSNGWSGGGVLIVEGDLKITGGVFNGVIWIIGALAVSGNPTINGGIFVEGGVSSDTTISGTAQINLSSGDINNASTQLVTVLSLVPLEIENWKEV